MAMAFKRCSTVTPIRRLKSCEIVTVLERAKVSSSKTVLLESTTVSPTAGGSLHECITALALYSPVPSKSAAQSTPSQASFVEHSKSSLPGSAASIFRTSQVEATGGIVGVVVGLVEGVSGSVLEGSAAGVVATI